MRPIKPWTPDENGVQYVARLEGIIDKMRAERIKLDRRIHNQRVALRENWEIVEMRASHQRAWLRSPLLRSILQRPRRQPWWRRLWRS